MKLLKIVGYWYTQYHLKRCIKLRNKGHKGTLHSEAAEFRRYYLK